MKTKILAAVLFAVLTCTQVWANGNGECANFDCTQPEMMSNGEWNSYRDCCNVPPPQYDPVVAGTKCIGRQLFAYMYLQSADGKVSDLTVEPVRVIGDVAQYWPRDMVGFVGCDNPAIGDTTY